MKNLLVRLLMVLVLCGGASVYAAPPANQAITARHLARLIADPVELAVPSVLCVVYPFAAVLKDFVISSTARNPFAAQGFPLSQDSSLRSE